MVPRGFGENDDRFGREVEGGHEAGKAGAPALALQLLDPRRRAEDGPPIGGMAELTPSYRAAAGVMGLPF
jgi:hypothetical protein